MTRASRALLGAAIATHLLLLVSWRTGTLNPLFFDAVVTHGRRGWDFYALYQAGHNVLRGDSAYESDGTQIDVAIPDGTYTPYRYLPLTAYTLGAALNLLPPLWAYRLWVAFTELVLLACVALTWRIVPGPNRRARLAAMWLVYTPYSRDHRTWKRYRGGMATDIWLFHLRDHTSKKITDWEGTDTQPMWHGGKVYYLSDRGSSHRRALRMPSIPLGQRAAWKVTSGALH